jgi:hypothetical protein
MKRNVPYCLLYVKVTHYIFYFTQIITLYVSGALNTALSSEHQKEIRRYLYNHQVRNLITLLQS